MKPIAILLLCGLAMQPPAAGAAPPEQSSVSTQRTPRLRLLDQSSLHRAISLCTEADRRLPLQHFVHLDEAGDLPGRLEMELVPLVPAPSGLRFHRGDIASGTLLTNTPTRIVLQAFVWDANILLRSSAVLASGNGQAVYTATFCSGLGMCTELREHITFVYGTDAIQTTQCDRPPELRPEDDDGDRNDDDYTSAQPLRFDIQSTAGIVTLLRDGIAIDSGAVINGSVTLQDASAPAYALHAYQAVHGSGVPSASRYVERYRAGLPLFGDGFEAPQ